MSGGDFKNPPDFSFIVETDCYRCGHRTKVVVHKDIEFDRAESQYWEARYKDLMGRLNSLLRFVEIETGWNPAKEKFIKNMVALRDKMVKGINEKENQKKDQEENGGCEKAKS